MRLIVSLPDNTVEFAKAAASGGADAVKVHLNVVHRASGASFGDFAAERPRVEAIIKEAGVPVGLMPGTERLPEKQELEALIDVGLKFIDIYAHHLPACYLELGEKTELIPAIDRLLTEGEIFHLTHVYCHGKNVISMLEAAVIPPEQYGQPLMQTDIALYRAIAAYSDRPLLIPTQKLITPSDLRVLQYSEIGGIMLGVVVTGPTPGGVEKVTREFRQAIDELLNE
jgi:hypothetical protein